MEHPGKRVTRSRSRTRKVSG